MPDDRTFATELSTALGMLGGESVGGSARSRPDELRIDGDQWERLETLTEGPFAAESLKAFENGKAFLESPDALRGRRPILIEWTGGRRPPGDEVAPIDLRVDHVFLVSCKYVSANIANPSPARLFDGLLATTGDWARGDWYLETAPDELTQFYALCKKASGLPDLPDDPSALEPWERMTLRRALPSRSLPDEVRPAYLDLCKRVSETSATRWREAVERFGRPELVLWRLLRIGSAPYYLLGADSRRALRLRVASPWDWRQDFRFLDLEITAASVGQPQVDWVATYETKATRERSAVRGHVEVRWSHGRFAHPPEAKIYLDTPTTDLPGYHRLLEASPEKSGRAPRAESDQPRLFTELPGE
jgi:hypothetical protein